MEELPSKKFPKRRITLACLHEPHMCRSCVRFSIELQIKEKQWFVKCPLCPEKLAFETVKKYTSEEIFEQYDRLAALRVLSSMPDFRLCINPECGSGQLHDSLGGELPIWSCHMCETKVCFKHEVEWHEEMGCDEYEETVGKKRLEEIESSMKLLKEVRTYLPAKE